MYVTDKKGGSLASEVFKYKQHGDPVLRSTVRHLLSLVGDASTICYYLTVVNKSCALRVNVKHLPYLLGSPTSFLSDDALDI